jgi:hypothetical protein
MRVSMTWGVMSMFSWEAMKKRREKEEVESRGVKRNLEQREARGSMMLDEFGIGIDFLVRNGWREKRGDASVPSDVVAHQAESSDFGVCFHNSAEGTLGVLGHGVRFVQYDDFVRWTWVCFAVRGDGLGARGLARKVLDFFADDGDSAFV